ncbi:DUF2793 domain-containing protein [Sphingomonas sp. NBWT7]|uniref:DUF2793 domain-containing protein n=1 Tax=Sphingomonas sp. NBWT7 TaxID=2596913 RepID=UPI00162872F8|nr:DUF2793 domain-containing protein [Sphingomonas sp. NBWT7]QNE32258.1 DUF2793 domain-containing protein [Sphingomonas sp. NBWT7]
MSEERTARFGLPLLHASQAQKELDHNEAITLLEILAQPVVRGIGVDVPPSESAAGDSWVTGMDPVGEWSGHPDALAVWTAGGWRFMAACDGMTVRQLDGMTATRVAGVWQIGRICAEAFFVGNHQVVGPRGSAIVDPSGGGTVDREARAAVLAILSALRSHGLVAP